MVTYSDISQAATSIAMKNNLPPSETPLLAVSITGLAITRPTAVANAVGRPTAPRARCCEEDGGGSGLTASALPGIGSRRVGEYYRPTSPAFTRPTVATFDSPRCIASLRPRIQSDHS